MAKPLSPPLTINCATAPAGRFQQSLALPIRAGFILFVFSIPFENIDLFGITEFFTVAKMAGILLVGVALLQPTVCLSRPPLPFWCFAAYICVYSVRAFAQSGATMDVYLMPLTVIQNLIAFWISYNIFRCGGSETAFLAALALSNGAVAILGHLGAASTESGGMILEDLRRTTLGQNANHLAWLYALGLLAMLGLMTRKWTSRYWRLLGLPLLAFLAFELVATGSRGGMATVVLSLAVYGVAAPGTGGKIKGVIVVGVVVLAFIMLIRGSETSAERWRRSFESGETAGRGEIFEACVRIFLDRPIVGWGPSHLNEVSVRTRCRYPIQDTHNDIMWALTATGLCGGVFFLSGLGLCLMAAWKGRKGRWGPLPLSLVVAALVMGLSGTMHLRKPFWLVMAFAVASASDFARVERRPAKRGVLS